MDSPSQTFLFSLHRVLSAPANRESRPGSPASRPQTPTLPSAGNWLHRSWRGLRPGKQRAFFRRDWSTDLAENECQSHSLHQRGLSAGVEPDLYHRRTLRGVQLDSLVWNASSSESGAAFMNGHTASRMEILGSLSSSLKRRIGKQKSTGSPDAHYPKQRQRSNSSTKRPTRVHFGTDDTKTGPLTISSRNRACVRHPVLSNETLDDRWD